MKACNTRNKKIVSSNVIVAERLLERMRGLLGKRGLENGESLLIKPCKGVHTLGMRFPIDVIFLDSGNNILNMRENMPPNRISSLSLRTSMVLELQAGTISLAETRIGDRIIFELP